MSPDATGLTSLRPDAAAAMNVNINSDPKLEEAVRSIDNEVWKSLVKDYIRGIN